MVNKNVIQRVQGYISDRAVFINFRQLFPSPSQKIVNHSPDGFMWGYGGSGPAQLALAIMNHVLGAELAQKVYQEFKWEVIAKLDKDRDFDITFDTQEWLDRAKNKKI